MSTNTTSCTVIAPGDGERFWLISDLMTPLITAEKTGGAFEMVSAVSVTKGGPPPHVHHLDDEMFYVVDGEFDFTLRDQVVRGGPGTCVFLPRGVVHTFNHVGDKSGRMIATMMPGGFGKFAKAASMPCTDPTTPPTPGPEVFERLAAACAAHQIEFKPDWKADKTAPAPAKRQELWVVGLHIKILLTSEETAGQCSVVEITAHPGNFVPVHFHHREDEVFYVLEGAVEFDLAGKKLTATPGTFIHVPKKTMHGFRNLTSTPARMANWHTPGGFDKFFVAAGTPCDDITKGPPVVAPDMAQFVRTCNQHGMELAAE